MSSIIELLKTHHVEFRLAGEHHHVSRGWIGLDCPECGAGTRQFHLGIQLEQLRANCWRCGSFGLPWILSKILPLSIAQIQKSLGDPKPSRYVKQNPQGKTILPPGIGPLQKQHEKYLRSRRFDPKKIQQLWNVQGLTIAGRLSWRLFIPLHKNGELASWTTRSIYPDTVPKYLTASTTQSRYPKASLLYGIDYCRGSTILLCEGPTDVWRLGPGAVASLGVGYSLEQLVEVARFPNRFICFDSDVPGQRRSDSLIEQLSCLDGSTKSIQIDAADPGELTEKEADKIRRLVFHER